ncbi:hypothetical protein FQN60_007791 [Etheostoma spectabile]|uniref:Plectin/eS10 N-terminal domain-containing protein n=1 Tax=Etheostoma spectabile TaxID=54343 RepID=A0A5J5CV24_9PERO|nr:hypothetical protein FQN60_007791 [Etheostoma spectabile]
MVAGMVMPLADLRAIYELLFRDGVIVTKKDKHPHSMHPDVPGVTNMKVISAMGSLKSKGCVRETFAWKHAYYYFTNKGIAYLRDYLRLPPEVMPASLQHVRRPASSAQVQSVKGPTSYIPKPKPKPVRESQETLMDRHIYRHKRVKEGEQAEIPTIHFRGSYQCDASVGQPGIQTQTLLKRDKDFCRGVEHWANQVNRKGFGASCLPTKDRTTRCPDSVKEAKLPDSLVHSSSIVPKFSKEMPTVHMAPCAPVAAVLEKCVEKAAPNPPAALEELNVPGELVPGVKPGEHVVVDQQTVLFLAELTEKDEQPDVKDGVLEKADVGTEETVKKLSYEVETMKQLYVDVIGPVSKAKASKSDSDHDSVTSPQTATEPVVDYDIADVADTQKVMEMTIPTTAISGFHVSETSTGAASEAGSPSTVVPSECPVVALKTTLLQGDQSFLKEDPEKQQDVQRHAPLEFSSEHNVVRSDLTPWQFSIFSKSCEDAEQRWTYAAVSVQDHHTPSLLSSELGTLHFVPGPMPAIPPGNVFPALVVVGHIVTLIFAWQWRVQKKQGGEGPATVSSRHAIKSQTLFKSNWHQPLQTSEHMHPPSVQARFNVPNRYSLLYALRTKATTKKNGAAESSSSSH